MKNYRAKEWQVCADDLDAPISKRLSFRQAIKFARYCREHSTTGRHFVLVAPDYVDGAPDGTGDGLTSRERTVVDEWT